MRATGWVVLVAMGFATGSAAWAQSGNPGSAPQPGRRIVPLVRAQATLETSLDAKKAKPGDPVRAKLEASVAIPDGPTLEKNTILEGHIDQVQASEHHSDSSLVVTFDQAKLRNGETLPVKLTILSVHEPILSETEYGAPAAISQNQSPAPARPGNFAPPAGPVPATPASQPQQPQGQNPQPQPQTSGVPGVTLRSDIHEPASARFLAERHNVHVPEGTEMQVAVGVIPKGVQLQ